MAPRTLMLLLVAALGYILSPVDLLPDLFVGVGWLDDAFVLGLLAYLIFGYLPKHGGVKWGDERRAADAGADNAGPQRREDGFDKRFSSADPYTVLGIPASAESGEIKRAYRDLLAQYHPDKVAHLSPEFQELAHERVVAIQRAFAQVGKP